MPSNLRPVKYRSRWLIKDDNGDTLISSLKTKRQAIQVIGEIEAYRQYNGTDHTGQKINGFDIGGRYGYYAVDERCRGNKESTAIARTVAADLTYTAAHDLAHILNQTCRSNRQ